MISKLFIFIGLFFVLFKTNDSEKSSKIYWHQRNAVTWNDFRKTAHLSGNEAAQISTGIQYSVKMENKTLSFVVRSYADKKNSFYIKKKKSDRLLKHEQGHFDICEIFARKLRKQLMAKPFKQKSLNSEAEKIYKKTIKGMNKFQHLYDKETNHSIDTTMQNKWNTKIAKMISELEPYKSVKLNGKIQ